MAVAPTYASTLTSGQPYHIPGDLKEVCATGTVGASDTYATGGFTVAASTFGLSRLDWVSPINFSTGHWGVCTTALPASTVTFKVFSAAATELTNTSSALQSATFGFKALGK